MPFLAFSHEYWVAFIIPIDELIFFRGVALAHQPDRRLQTWDPEVEKTALGFLEKISTILHHPVEDPVLAVMMNGPPLFSPALCTRVPCHQGSPGITRDHQGQWGHPQSMFDHPQIGGLLLARVYHLVVVFKAGTWSRTRVDTGLHRVLQR